MSQSLRMCLAQINVIVGDIKGNCARIIEAVLAAQQQQADAIVFPELVLTGYPPEDLLLRPAMQLLVEQAIAEIVQCVGADMTVIFGAPSYTPQGLFNSALAIQDGRIVACYHKQCLPNYNVFDEKRYFQPGSTAVVVDIKGVAVALTICEDVWYPQPMQQAKVAGAQLVVSLNASPFHRFKRRERIRVLQERVSETGLPIIYVNLVGGQDELVFDGDSLVMRGDGEVEVQLAPFIEQQQLVDIDVVSGAVPLPLRYYAAELSEEQSVYQALVLGVRDYIEKNGFNGVVIGLSGGVDSALTLAIAVDAIGAERVEAVMMPSRYTAAMSLEDAHSEAQALGVEYHQISIEPVYQAFLDSLADEFAGTTVDTTEENIQARCRGVILMAISNKKHKIVLTTGNKSEMSVGYATLYGDMAGGFAPLKDVPKMLVYRLAHYRNQPARVIPERVLTRPPSAELAAGQKDADSLPPYEILDAIVELYVEQDKSPDAIIERGHDAAIVARVVHMINRNEYKRRQSPPGVRITRRAFGRDRRYPITSRYQE